KSINIEDFSVVDLFCGVGGLTHGFVKENFKVEAGINFDNSCKYAFEKNNNAKFYHEDITDVTSEQLNAKFDQTKRKILVGCAPCQPFSIYNSRSSNKNKIKTQDEKWKLLYSFARLIEETLPDIVSMENVP
ncbi:DNA cytosine methyltransferase, partial [Burkholderia sp. SIMBA_042]|uniref:DNA cytosine methyltransferase n=1 Tax=Burkholderia sp. SIMBA_042 TaxID=3085783 RepID=UPI0039786BF6